MRQGNMRIKGILTEEVLEVMVAIIMVLQVVHLTNFLFTTNAHVIQQGDVRIVVVLPRM